MTRLLMLLAAALVLAHADAAAQPRGPKTPPAEKDKAAAAQQTPLQIYLAKGDANACGEGCSEWIAVEGWFDQGAAGRVQAFLRRHGARKLPVYFHSPGGHGTEAFTIGRQLRQLGFTTGVSMTVPRGCASSSDRSDACRAAKRSPQAVTAELRPDGGCHSACVYALIGGKVRQVPPSARLGVHSAKVTVTRVWSDGRKQQLSPKLMPSMHKAKAAEFDAMTRRYVREMGIDAALLDVAFSTPHEDIAVLSRDQIVGFGIDSRDFTETRWFIAPLSNTAFHLSKWFVEARGPGRKDHRTSIVSLSCGSNARVGVLYMRGLASDEVAGPASVVISFGDRKASLTLNGVPTRRDALDTGASFASIGGIVPLVTFGAVGSTGSIDIVESELAAAKRAPRVIKLSAEGFVDGIRALRDKCLAAAPATANP